MKELGTFLTSTIPPWLLRTEIERPEIESRFDALGTNCGFVTRLLDACKMATVDDVFTQFAVALDFPDYFGFNSAAFDECLTDLSWFDAKGFCIAVLDAEHLLCHECDDLSWLLALLEDACNTWSVAVNEGEAWDRAAVPFHILFHSPSGSLPRLPAELAALPSLEQQSKQN